MIKERLSAYINQRKTLLGVGPMSTNCIDAAIELSNEYDIPIMLIASRRQIDSVEFGGGYVNHWTTEEFAEYVFSKDKGGKVLLCRDHGGPWQSEQEKKQNLGLRNAMESAKLSFQHDIEAGIQIIHIDPSVDIHSKPTMNEIVDRVLELYEFCWDTAIRCHKRIEFEIGTEEQSGSTSSGFEFERMLQRINRYCDLHHMPSPMFVVVQNGTKVQETSNVGSFDIPVRVVDEVAPEIQIPLMEKICRENGVYIKAHNTDYLSNDSLVWYPRLGIHAANVAPEFGVVETESLLEVLETYGMIKQRDAFIRLAYDSRKWEKWMRGKSDASDEYKAIIAGHYIFSENAFLELKEKIQYELRLKGIELDVYLKERIRDAIMRYLVCFRMIG